MNTCRSPSNKDEFTQYYQLRWEILRKPWNQPLGSEQDNIESSCFHRMIIDENEQVLAVGRLEKSSNNTAQIRFMAVRNDFQGKGLGKQIMQSLEEKAYEEGIDEISLNAREAAEAFYHGLGYTSNGLAHLLYGQIQHILMTKKLRT